MSIAGATPSIKLPSLLPESLVADRRERLLYIQSMRAVAIFIIVATHCRDPFLESTFIRSDAVGVLFRHISIIFIFISGFLFQFLLRRFGYFYYLETKLRNVIIPYMIVRFQRSLPT